MSLSEGRDIFKIDAVPCLVSDNFIKVGYSIFFSFSFNSESVFIVLTNSVSVVIVVICCLPSLLYSYWDYYLFSVWIFSKS